MLPSDSLTGCVSIVVVSMAVMESATSLEQPTEVAAAEQNKFWEYHELLMALEASPKVEGDLSTAVLQSLAEEAGLDMEAFNAALSSAKYQDYIDRDFDEGLELELRGTPTFFINGEKVEGYMSFETLHGTIEALLGETGTTE